MAVDYSGTWYYSNLIYAKGLSMKDTQSIFYCNYTPTNLKKGKQYRKHELMLRFDYSIGLSFDLSLYTIALCFLLNSDLRLSVDANNWILTITQAEGLVKASLVYKFRSLIPA